MKKDKSSIVGVGIDIEEVARFRQLPFSKNKPFYQKIFTKDEIKYCQNQGDPSQHFAARFCAKEALIKASPRKIKNPLDIQIISKNGKPAIEDCFNGNKIYLSISHTKNYAVAAVIITK